MARLYALIARDAPKAVVLRRGPSRQTCLIAWDLRRDRFEVGQWLKARVFERRCDLSPSGDKLIYFASNYGRRPYTWTAVSRPPYFTALLFWPKGDSWGGGGLFETEQRIALNHPANRLALGEGLRVPRGVTIDPLTERAGAGEDAPVHHLRLVRDGWKLESSGAAHWNRSGPESVTYDVPEVYARASPSGGWSLVQRLRARFVRNGPVYAQDFALRSDSGEEQALGRLDWADWSPKGDVLFAKGGRLFRISARRDGPHADDAVELADFSALRFEAKEAPPEALRW